MTTDERDTPGEVSDMDGRSDASDEPRRLLERHVDHLLGQLHHQMTLLESYRREQVQLRDQVNLLEQMPEELDAAHRRIHDLRERATGLRELEIELRRRIDELEVEDQRKGHHIGHLERELSRFANLPHRRLLRALRSWFGGSRGNGAPPG